MLGWNSDQHGDPTVTGNADANNTYPIATDKSITPVGESPYYVHPRGTGDFASGQMDASTWSNAAGVQEYQGTHMASGKFNTGAPEAPPFYRFIYRKNYYPGFYAPPGSSPGQAAFTYKDRGTYKDNTDQNGFSHSKLGTADNLDASKTADYKDKIVYEINKFFTHARKWIWSENGSGGSSTYKHTYHFTYSFEFESNITSHMQGWIQWLYYIITGLSSTSGSDTGEHSESGKTMTGSVAYNDIKGDIWTYESQTWVLLDDLSEGGDIEDVWYIGSVTVTQNFQLLDNVNTNPDGTPNNSISWPAGTPPSLLVTDNPR